MDLFSKYFDFYGGGFDFLEFYPAMFFKAELDSMEMTCQGRLRLVCSLLRFVYSKTGDAFA